MTLEQKDKSPGKGQGNATGSATGSSAGSGSGLSAQPGATGKASELNDQQRDALRRESLLRDSLLIAQIEGMHSHTCEETIVSALSKVTGVKEAEVDFASGQTSVIFDARRITAHQLIQMVADLGYRIVHYATGQGGGALQTGQGTSRDSATEDE